ncbi:hypothetical protein GCM10011414_03400 [Croceivirga lutea]|uniref:Ig-like domain-containing protein n=1 Tax=Croceivirga lutea TaxID=1775167 RepID=UPI00163A0427|nr:Ig-like domain-containing protein [Croceivirga lutea]GGG37332.1 hypothetical protein GCM10011414_03400 [Croceivirga lutea]
MPQLKQFLSVVFFILLVLAISQCARRGTPSGGPKDIQPPVLVSAEPENMTTNFKATTIKLFFDEYIKLENAQAQIIISPPLKNVPEIKPQGGASKFIEITLKDTLRENTTYTINFGQSIVDNNEGNPNKFLRYVFSTGDYIDSLSISGAVKDAYNKKAEEFVSVMLYEIDSAYNDSTIYKYPPNYLTNTLDSLPLFSLQNLKAGKYKLFALKDNANNNVFDQNADKIAFLNDTITLPTDSVYLLNLFKEIPDYVASVPSYAAKNRILFGFTTIDSTITIEPITPLPDSVKTKILKERDKDSLNFWLTATDIDSIIFQVKNLKYQTLDTFTVKARKLALDTMNLRASHSSRIDFEDKFKLLGNTPIIKVDSSKIGLFDKDTLPVSYSYNLDTVKNQVDFDFDLVDNQSYFINLLPGAIEDFFGTVNDTLNYKLSTGSYADYGNLNLTISGAVTYPIIVQLLTDKGEIVRENWSQKPQTLRLENLKTGNYTVRVIFDENSNKKWDTGNYLTGKQPEKIVHYPDVFEMRANWEANENFIISN